MLSVDAVQLRLIADEEIEVAESPAGMEGEVVSAGGGVGDGAGGGGVGAGVPPVSGCGYVYGMYPGFAVVPLFTKSTSPFECGLVET